MILTALLALVSALLAVSFPPCAGCHRYSAEVFGLPVLWPAVVCYTVLSLLALRPDGWARILLNGSGFVTGVHLYLLAVLLKAHAFCFFCMWLAACSVGCTLAVFIQQRRAVILSAALFLGVVFSSSLVHFIPVHVLHEFPEIEAQVQDRLSQLNGRRTILVLGSSACPVCESFWREDAPLLEKTFGDRVVFARASPAPGTPAPMLIFAAENEEPFVVFGRPPYGLLQELVGRFLQ